MATLDVTVRRRLEAVTVQARRAAESACAAALDGLGVWSGRRPEHLDPVQAALRVGLRAKWRQLGEKADLVAECSFEQWHRLLFARFLAENDLLLHPSFRAPVSLADCEELAPELGEPDAWSVAARFAAEILPGIFRLDDPCVRLRLPPEGRHALEQVLNAIPAQTFAADDALGWVYQFWQRDKKDEVNASERKIAGADLGPVTQLFTESYMVRFLLQNSLGAWWAEGHPDSPLVDDFDYLRVDEGGRAIVSSFNGWPDRVADVTVIDPCCGSGHFLVEAFSMLWQMRAEEEGLSPIDAQNAVLRDNLFGLELDPRCVEIAMFAIALQAWKAGGGWRPLPVPNIACSGLPANASTTEWTSIARGDPHLEGALLRLHALFRDADTLGSLIDPERAVRDSESGQPSLTSIPWGEIAPLLESVLGRETTTDPATMVLGESVGVVARAASLLAGNYTLAATNVPYLGRGLQGDRLRQFLDRYHRNGSPDLATAFIERMLRFSVTVAVVSPHGWFFLHGYEAFRRDVLDRWGLRLVARLGSGAFSGISGEVVKVALCLIDRGPRNGEFASFDLQAERTAADKRAALATVPGSAFRASEILSLPGAVLPARAMPSDRPLSEFCYIYEGTKPGQTQRSTRYFWELPAVSAEWKLLQTSPDGSRPYTGATKIIYSDALLRQRIPEANTSGREGRGRPGVLIAKIGDLPASLAAGVVFDNNTFAIIPKDSHLLPALWAFADSGELATLARALNQKLDVSQGAVGAVPFEVDRWTAAVASIPERFSDDPTQWLFDGRPQVSTAPLQVAVARLVGYRWPEQAESDDLHRFADADGIVCLPSVAGEAPAAERVGQVLAVAVGDSWSPGMVKGLLEQAGSKKGLADWLRDEFFKQHCALFGSRPFVWHIWDGQRDGFAALVNYHRLDKTTLQKLTYTYLGVDWMERQRAEVRDEVAGAEARLSAALKLQRKLEAILDGETPHDIYVRWKGLHEQPVGWEPDLNDGVRLNIRPFVEAGVLRAPVNIHWRKDRGKNPDGSERRNDTHLSLAEKLEARKRAGRA